MHVLLIILGVLLLLFGGGCTLIFLSSFGASPSYIFSDPGFLFGIWLPLGLLPLVGGGFMLRAGLRIDRQKRQAKSDPEAKP